MGAARASTAGHWELAFSALSETQTAYATGHGTSGFLLITASLGMSPLSFFSLFLTSFHDPNKVVAYLLGTGVAHVENRNGELYIVPRAKCGRRRALTVFTQ
jgi:hypothetical protein